TDEVHFHEVGALDSIADIVGAAVGLDLLGAEEFTSGPVAVGGGTVKCEHGVMPVPAPATANLLRGVPLGPSAVKAELTTPPGAAIPPPVADRGVESPPLPVGRIGYGAGPRDFASVPNVLRLMVGVAATSPAGADRVWVLETNLDDVPAEVVGYCFERLFAAG